MFAPLQFAQVKDREGCMMFLCLQIICILLY